MTALYYDHLATIIMKLVWLIGSAAIAFRCSATDSKPTKEQFSWDLNKSPPPEGGNEQVEHSFASSISPPTLGITRTRSNFARKKRTNFGSLPELVKDVNCKHSSSCIHWKSMTRNERHVVSNRRYRQNNVSKMMAFMINKKSTNVCIFVCRFF